MGGNWFVLYQMSRNMNRRFFAEFLTVLAFFEQQHGKEQLDQMERAPLSKNDDDVDSIKKMNGALVVPKKANQERRPSKLITVPSCVSLHSEIYDLTYDKEDGK